MSRVGATAAAIEQEFLNACDDLVSEKYYKVLKVGPHVIPLKSTDTYFIGIVMAWFIVRQSQAPEAAFKSAITVTTMQIVGGMEEKVKANNFFKSCIDWHHKCQAIDVLNSDKLAKGCRKYVTARIDKDGVDYHPSMHNPQMNESQSEKEMASDFSESENRSNEKTILIVKYGTHNTPLKWSDLHFMARIMAFVIRFGRMSEENALEYAIATFVLRHDGTDQEKTDAEITAKSALEWECDATIGQDGIVSAEKFAELIQFKVYCSRRLKEHFGLFPKPF